jgi:hypothetical protein
MNAEIIHDHFPHIRSLYENTDIKTKYIPKTANNLYQIMGYISDFRIPVAQLFN